MLSKLIRQYIPKKSNFNSVSDKFIMDVAKKLNLRLRKNSDSLIQKPSSSNKSIFCTCQLNLHLQEERGGV